MAGSLLDLAQRLEIRKAALETAASKAAVFLAMAILRELVRTTPVDTSTALSNWQVTLNAPIGNVISPYFRGQKGSTFAASGNAAIAQAEIILAAKRPGQPIYISNNVPYIRRLNEGYSAQAPAGFVERALIVGKRAVRNFNIGS